MNVPLSSVLITCPVFGEHHIQEFISESLRQISLGVCAVRNEKGIAISPQALTGRDNSAGGHMVTMSGHHAIMLVEFDLSVAVQSRLEGEAGGGLTILGVGGKADVSGTIDQTRIQRIKFQVPASFTPHES